MPISIEQAAVNLVLALICGGLIGSERQVRQRMAGLRTNALVALGAASYVVFSAQFPDELSPTRVGAQVVSGIGFLGAGIIFRHGFTVHGLNTAATLWCSAAVGLLAGASAAVFAMMATALIIFVNLGLRPLVRFLKSKTRAGLPLTTQAHIKVVCKEKSEATVRRLLLSRLPGPEFQINGLEVSDHADKGLSVIELDVSVQGASASPFQAAMEPLVLDAKVKQVTWDADEDS